MTTLFNQVKKIVEASRPGTIELNIEYNTPEDTINPPTFTYSKGKTWAFFQKGEDTHVVLKTDPATTNAQEESILWALTNGKIQHPNITIDYGNEKIPNLNLIKLSHRLYDGSLCHLKDNKGKDIADTDWYQRIYTGQEEEINKTLLHYNPETLLFGGYGSHGKIKINGEIRKLSKPITRTSLVEGMMSAKCYGKMGLKRGAGSFMPLARVGDDAEMLKNSKSSSVGLNDVPVNLDPDSQKNNLGSISITDPQLRIKFVLTRMHYINIGNDKAKNLAVRRYLLALWLVGINVSISECVKNGNFSDSRRGCYLIIKKDSLTYNNDTLNYNEAIDCYKEAYDDVKDLLLTTPITWKATDDYSKAVVDSQYKPTESKKAKKSDKGVMTTKE